MTYPNPRSALHCASHLLNRTPPPEYLAEWQQNLTKEKERVQFESRLSVVVFRLGVEWFALESGFVREIREVPVIHTLPQQRARFLMGVVNVRGRLRMCVSLIGLLEAEEEQGEARKCYPRVLVLRRHKEIYVCPVNEVFGVQLFEKKDVKNVPATVEKSTANFLKGMIPWEHTDIGLLDEELLFPSLRRNVKA